MMGILLKTGSSIYMKKAMGVVGKVPNL